MNLKLKTNQELVSTLKLQVENERRLLMEIFYSLQEVELRSLHLEMGYPDLYTFAMKELGYSSGAAYRRISAMRLLKSVPEIAPKLESGELGLENASQAQSFFRKEDQSRRDRGLKKLSRDEKREVVSELLGKSTREGIRVLMERAPDIMIPTEKLRPLPEQKTMIQFVASAELMGKLEELKQLLAHQNYEGRMDVLVEKLADMALKKLKPARAALSPAPGKVLTEQDGSQRASTEQTGSQWASTLGNQVKRTRSRYISAQIRRQVLIRDQNGCTYRDPKTGRVCGSRYGLQFDHLVPFSWGGKHSVGNLALKCGAHNRFRAEQMQLLSKCS
jgi:5-methylcytosine-specific restriction endonuclease McrA